MMPMITSAWENITGLEKIECLEQLPGSKQMISKQN